MKSPFPADEETIMHQFDRLCQKSLKGEAVNYYRYMDNRRKREITLSELSEEEFEKFATIDEYFFEYQHFSVLDYDIKVTFVCFNDRIFQMFKKYVQGGKSV